MKWGSSENHIKLQYFPHFGAVVHVLQRHGAGSPTSGSCCHSSSSSSFSEMGKAHWKKFPTSSSLLEMKAQEMKGKESLLPLQVLLFSFLSLIWVWAIFPTLWNLHLPPPVAPRLVPRELGPQHVQPLIKAWTKQFNHSNLATGGKKGMVEWGKSQVTTPGPAAPQVTAHFMPPTHNPGENPVQQRSQQWLFTHLLKR